MRWVRGMSVHTTVEMALVQVKMCPWLSMSLLFSIYATAKLVKVLIIFFEAFEAILIITCNFFKSLSNVNLFLEIKAFL